MPSPKTVWRRAVGFLQFCGASWTGLEGNGSLHRRAACHLGLPNPGALVRRGRMGRGEENRARRRERRYGRRKETAGEKKRIARITGVEENDSVIVTWNVQVMSVR